MSENELLVSHQIRVADVAHRPLDITLEPDAATREAVASAWSLPAISALKAAMKAELAADGQGILVTGTLEAEVVQRCVVTLADVPATLSVPFERLYLPPSMIVEPDDVDEDGNLVIDLDSEDPEPLVGGAADVGHLLLEELSLALDPFPRAPGVAFTDIIEDADEHPFAALAALRPGEDKA